MGKITVLTLYLPSTTQAKAKAVLINTDSNSYRYASMQAGNSDACYEYYTTCPICNKRNYIHAGVTEKDFISAPAYQMEHADGVCPHYTGWFYADTSDNASAALYFEFLEWRDK